jgi:hypothetical protein
LTGSKHDHPQIPECIGRCAHHRIPQARQNDKPRRISQPQFVYETNGNNMMNKIDISDMK